MFFVRGLGVDHDALVNLAEKHFTGLRSTYDSHDKLTPCRYTGSEVGLCSYLLFYYTGNVRSHH